MKKLNKVTGDLIEMAKNGDFDVIVHGCNCFNTMGAGIALQIKNKLPGAALVDSETVRGDSSKLGNMTVSVHTSDFNTKYWVINAYTQFFPGPNFDIEALKSVVKQIKMNFPECRIGFPLIGCGIGGGHWPEVRRVLRRLHEGQKGIDVTIVQYNVS